MTTKDPFEYQKPTKDQVRRISDIRQACRILSNAITRNTTPSRERSLAITKLEEVSLWANKAIVMEEVDAENPG